MKCERCLDTATVKESIADGWNTLEINNHKITLCFWCCQQLGKFMSIIDMKPYYKVTTRKD